MRIEERSNYIEVIFDAQEDLIEYECEMILNNEIEGILSTTRRSCNGQISLLYDIRERLSLNRLGEGGKLSIQDYLSICLSILKTMHTLKEYSLYSMGALLEQKYLFVDPRNMQCSLIYLPNGRKDRNVAEIQKFFRELLFSSLIRMEDGTAVNEIVQVLNEAFESTAGFSKKMEDLKRKYTESVQRIPQPISTSFPQNEIRTLQPIPIKEEPSGKQQEYNEPIQPMPEERASEKKRAFGKGKKDKTEKKEKQREKKEHAKGTKDRSNTILLLVGGVMLVAIAFLYTHGFFVGENNALDTSKLAGLFIIAAGVEFLIYRKLRAAKGEEDKTLHQNRKEKRKREKEEKRKTRRGKKNENKKGNTENETDKSAISPKCTEYGHMAALEDIQQERKYIESEQPSMIQKSIKHEMPSYFQPSDSDATEYLGMAGGVAPAGGITAYLENAMGERHYLTAEHTRIGKQADKVEIVLRNTKVSRLHAEIYQKDGQFYLMDMRSSNGTYLNHSHERLTACVDYELKSGDTIRFANEEFVFRMGR